MLAAVVCILTAGQACFAGQSNSGLRVQIIQGNGARNKVGEIPPDPITVQILNRQNRPVPNATVTFTAPLQGPSGSFANGSNVLRVTTDFEGRALATFYQANSIEGPYLIQIRAEYQGLSATAAVRQNNVAVREAASSSKKKLIIVILAAVGAAGAAAVAAGGGGGESSNPNSGPPPAGPPAISFGGATVGAPQ